jgi:hypothetical protein
MFLHKNKSVFDKINEYLIKKGHEMIVSLYLADYNGHNIYVRFDYVKKITAYKIVWVDLGFLDIKKMDEYINQQLVTKGNALKFIEEIVNLKIKPGFKIDEKIKGDRVELLSYFPGNNKEYIFSRFLPLEWEALIPPLALIFSYLPRTMEVFVTEMFAIFDGREEYYNLHNPLKFNLMKGDLEKLFKEQEINRAKKYTDGGRVTFLEKIENTYIGIVSGFAPYLVAIEELEDGYIRIKANCKCENYCKHICSVILAIREKKFNSFYKVRYSGMEDQTLLDKMVDASFNLCFGIDGDKLLLVTPTLEFLKVDLIKDGKMQFEIIEDDDECNLTKSFEDLIKK